MTEFQYELIKLVAAINDNLITFMEDYARVHAPRRDWDIPMAKDDGDLPE